MDIEKAKNRCNELVKVEHANWIGISNQEAIQTVLNELDKKEKIINKMAMKINEAYFDENDFWLWFEKEICKDDMVKADKSKQIIDYFTKKVEGE